MAITKKQSQKIRSYRSLPGTLSGRLDTIQSHFAAALTGIEEELERPPDSQKGLLRFLRALQERAVFGEFRIEDYRCYKLGEEDGTVFEYYDGEKWSAAQRAGALLSADLGPKKK